MHPILLDFGWHDMPLWGRLHLYIGTYGIFFAAAAALGWIVWMKVARRDGLDTAALLDLGFFALISGLVGSKLGLILLDPGYFLSDLRALLWVLRAAGILLFGVVAALVTIIVYCRRHGLPLWKVLDSAAPALALGQAIGRLGCFAAGCCYGTPAPGLPWGVCFTDPAAAQISGTPLCDPDAPGGAAGLLHPTQLYQASADFALFGLLYVLSRRARLAEGLRALTFIILYSISRGLLEFLRGDLERGVWPVPGTSLALSTSQLLSVAGLVYSIWAWPRLRRRARETEAAPAPRRRTKR